MKQPASSCVPVLKVERRAVYGKEWWENSSSLNFFRNTAKNGKIGVRMTIDKNERNVSRIDTQGVGDLQQLKKLAFPAITNKFAFACIFQVLLSREVALSSANPCIRCSSLSSW